MFDVTYKHQYGYVGPVKRPSTLIKIDGKTVARIAESQRFRGKYFAEFSFNGGRTYSWSWSSSSDREELLQAATEAAVKLCKDLRKESQ